MPMRPEIWLLKEYQKRSEKNPLFSKRAFARILGISSGRLSEYLEGRRKITPKMADKFILNLKLNQSEGRHLKESLKKNPAREKRIPIPFNHYGFLSEPIVFGVLTAFEINPDGELPENVFLRFKTHDSEKLQMIVKQLMENGYLSKASGGKLKRSTPPVTTQTIPSQIIRDGHKKRLEDVIKRIDSLDPETRYVTSLTIPFNPKKYKKIIQLIEKFKAQVDEIATSGTREQVYNLNIQLFPLTDVSKDELM